MSEHWLDSPWLGWKACGDKDPAMFVWALGFYKRIQVSTFLHRQTKWDTAMRQEETAITCFLTSVLLLWWLALEAFCFFGFSEVDFLGKSPIRFVHPTLYLEEKKNKSNHHSSKCWTKCKNLQDTEGSTYLFAHTVEQNLLDLLKLYAKSTVPQNSHDSIGSALWLFSSMKEFTWLIGQQSEHQVCTT